MKVEIEVTVDDELRAELVVQLRDLICSLRAAGAEVTATFQGAQFEALCDDDDISSDNGDDEDGENEEENAYIDAENHFGEGFDEEGDFYDEES